MPRSSRIFVVCREASTKAYREYSEAVKRPMKVDIGEALKKQSLMLEAITPICYDFYDDYDSR